MFQSYTDQILLIITHLVEIFKKVKIVKPLNSTEKSTKRREVIYKDNNLHNALKKAEKVHKNAENVLNRSKRERDDSRAALYEDKQPWG